MADASTIQDKLLVGYQGWFTCAGDGPPIYPGHHGWLHWFHNPIPSGGRPNTDLWPDTSEYDPDELYPAPGLTTASGGPVYLFSSRNRKTVRRHFYWMAQHGVDGAFLQRFAGQCEIKSGNLGVRDLRDEVGDRVREAAEAEGRVYAIMYDVSGVAPDKLQGILEQDWAHLLTDKRLLDSPSYLHERGRPVVALWGFGLNGRHHTPDLVRAITAFFRAYTPGGVYLVAGTPGHWRTATSDADRNPEFVQVWTECFDAISPWTVGRYHNEESADRWGEERVKADVDYLNALAEQGGRRVDYMPVVLPGGSGFNLSQGKWAMNDVPRNGGRFLWRQMYNARRAGVRILYGAMWDEYDEGTAYMPVVSYASQLPVHPTFRFVALDMDGHDLPSDWYMRIAGLAAEALHEGRPLPDTFPYKELQDYWHTRPRGKPQGQINVDAVTHALGGMQVGPARDAPSDAPPPYSLEDTAPPVPAGRGEKPRPPPVPLDTRPAVIPASLMAAAAVHAVSPTRHAGPPPVAMASRPSPGPGPSMGYAPPPVPPRAEPRLPPPPSHRPVLGMPVPGGYDHGRGRARSRSGSRSRSRSRSGSRKRKDKHKYKHKRRSRSRSRSSSGSRRGYGHGPSHSYSHGHGHGHHTLSHGHGHGHGHAHSMSPVGTSHGMYAPGGLGHAVSEGGYAHGYGGPAQGYTPMHSMPVGHGDMPVGAYGGYPAPQGYGPGFGPGYGQGAMAQPYPHGYTPHPSVSSPSSSSYYAPYGNAGQGGGGSSTGGGMASALNAVEGIAGRNARNQLEKTVKSLSNSLNKLR